MKKYLLGLIALTATFIVFAFVPAKQKVFYETVTFQYDPDNDTEIDNPDYWLDRTDGGLESCGSTGDLPCVISFSTEQFPPQSDDRGIASFLSTYTDAASIMNSGYLVDSKVEIP